MQRIKRALCTSYQHVCHRLLEPIIVKDVPLKARTNEWMRALAAQRIVRRPTCQYGSLSEFARYMNVPIELGIVSDGHSNSGIFGGLKKKVAGKGATCRITEASIRVHPEFELFRPLAFPLMHLDKPTMWRISKQNGYDHMMRMTWSCWYPTPAGKPCNKCLMCRERIIKQL